MDTIVFSNFSVRDLLVWGGIVVAGLFVIGFVVRLLRSPPKSQHHQSARCPKCGWVGQISKFAGRCPKCNMALGDRRAKP